MSQQQYKICPKCSSPAELFAPQCLHCGRQYRTQFADQTQVLAMPQPGFVPQYAGVPSYTNELDELERQYRQCTYMCCAFVFIFLPFVFITLLILLYFSSQFSTIRRHVSRLGINAEEWEAPLKRWARGVYAGWALGTLAVYILIGFLVATMFSNVMAYFAPPATPVYYQEQMMPPTPNANDADPLRDIRP